MTVKTCMCRFNVIKSFQMHEAVDVWQGKVSALKGCLDCVKMRDGIFPDRQPRHPFER